VSKCRRQAELDGQAGHDRDQRRRAFFPPHRAEKIRQWIHSKTATRGCLISREVKKEIVAELEKIDLTSFCRDYITPDFSRHCAEEVNVKWVPPLAEARGRRVYQFGRAVGAVRRRFHLPRGG
jgi:hypothetical protein